MSGTRVTGRLSGAFAAFVSTARHQDLRRAQLAFVGAWTAEWAFTVGLGVYAFRHGGAAAVGVVSLLRMLPSALLAPLLTPYADRWRRDRVLVAVSAVRGLATAVAAVLVATDGAVAAVYAMAILSTVVATLYRPAHSALLPSLCRTPQDLAGANVVRGMLDSLATLIGPALAAVMLEVSGVTAVFTMAAVASLWSSGLMLGVRPEADDRSAPARRRILADVRVGLRAVGSNSGLRILIGLTGAQTLTRGAVTVLTVVIAFDLLETGEAGVGTLTAAIGAGAVVGSFAASLLVGTRRLARWFGLGVALWGLPLALIAPFPTVAPTVLLLACVGIGNALVDVGLFTLIARLAPDAVLARVFGLLESVGAVSVGVGAILAPVAIGIFGLRGALVALGLVCPALVAASWLALTRVDTSMVARDHEVGLLREVPMLRPLALPAIELLASGLETVTVQAGAVVFEQGEPGDRFYVVDAGEAEVFGDGLAVTTLGHGDGFGEIALLRRVPRTATVRARTVLHLYSLTSERFLPVVTGYASSRYHSIAHVDSLLHRFAPEADDGASQ